MCHKAYVPIFPQEEKQLLAVLNMRLTASKFEFHLHSCAQGEGLYNVYNRPIRKVESSFQILLPSMDSLKTIALCIEASAATLVYPDPVL